MEFQDIQDSSQLNWYTDDPILTRYARRYLNNEMHNYVEGNFIKAGKFASEDMEKRAKFTDRDGAPKLIRYDREGNEIDEVLYNDGYLKTIKEGFGTGVVSLRYDTDAPDKVPFLVNEILYYILSKTEIGFTCPISLTQGTAFVLEKFGSKEQKEKYLKKIASNSSDKVYQGATWLTEINAGSDVGAIETKAVKNGDYYLLSGEKWFASNCDADINIALARVNDKPGTKGLGLFLIPKYLDNGHKNNIKIRRLKDKLGVRAVATGELILDKTVGYLIGDTDKGFLYMAEALNVSRLGTALKGLAIAQRAFTESMIYTSQRNAFGQSINKYPMVQETLMDMIVEIEAAWAVNIQMINTFDQNHTFNKKTDENYMVMRTLLSLGKYKFSDLGVTATKDAVELHGGNGYIEEYVTPRLYRDAMVNPVWEGTSNIQALEVMKLLNKGSFEQLSKILTEQLEKVTSRQMADTKEMVEKELNSAIQIIEYFVSKDKDYQQAYAKKVADIIYDICSSVFLLEEANYDIENDGNTRRFNIAKYWIDKVYSSRKDRGIMSGEIKSSDLFKEFVYYSDEQANTESTINSIKAQM